VLDHLSQIAVFNIELSILNFVQLASLIQPKESIFGPI
jgi:hypothetical protein